VRNVLVFVLALQMAKGGRAEGDAHVEKGDVARRVAHASAV
jgi:hypothetical protein